MKHFLEDLSPSAMVTKLCSRFCPYSTLLEMLILLYLMRFPYFPRAQR